MWLCVCLYTCVCITTLAKVVETTAHRWGIGACSLEHACDCSLACVAVSTFLARVVVCVYKCACVCICMYVHAWPCGVCQSCYHFVCMPAGTHPITVTVL